MLNLIRHHPAKDRDQIVVLLSLPRAYLQTIRSNPPPKPPPHSRAALAFDIHVTRKLSNFMPLKPHRLPPQDFAWNALADMLDGWADICKVSAVASLTTWKVGKRTFFNVASLTIFVDCRRAFRKFLTSFTETSVSPCSCTGQFPN